MDSNRETFEWTKTKLLYRMLTTQGDRLVKFDQIKFVELNLLNLLN